MKKIGLILGLAAVFALSVSAQQYKWTNAGATNNCLNNTTTTGATMSEITFNATRYNEVGIDIKYELNGAGTTACIFNFVKSMDGTNFNTTAPIAITQVPNGTTTVCTNLTVTMGPAGYIKLFSIVAGNNSQDMTNIVVGYTVKPNRRDGN